MDWTDFRDAQEHVQLDGLAPSTLEVAYREEGEGRPVLLLHGIPTWSYLWSNVLPGLRETAHVIAPDLLGYGYSDRRDAFDRSVRRQAKMITRLMDALGLETATVVGHDIGGAVAQVLALDYAERVEGLVLVDSVAYGSWPSASMAALGDPTLLGRPDAIMDLLRGDAEAGHAPGAEVATFRDAMVTPYDSEEGRRTMVRNASALNTNHTMELVSRLETIDVPTLVLWGAKDHWQPVGDAERLAAEIPDAKLAVVEEGAHWMPFDDPESTVHHLRAFLSGL